METERARLFINNFIANLTFSDCFPDYALHNECILAMTKLYGEMYIYGPEYRITSVLAKNTPQ